MSVNKKLQELVDQMEGEGSRVIYPGNSDFTMVPNWLLMPSDFKLDSNHRMVLIVIMKHCYGHKSSGFPSYKRIAGGSGIGESTVRKKVGELVAKGLLLKINRQSDGSGQTSNLYVVCGPDNLHGDGLDLYSLIKDDFSERPPATT